MNIANSWTGVGRFTKEHEVRYGGADNQLAILKNSIAIDRKQNRADKDANKPKVTDFVNVVFTGQMAETISKYTAKGSKIMIEGEIHTGSYKNKDGNTVYTTEVFANGFEFMESKKDSTTPAPIGAPVPNANGFVNVADGIEEELPFF